MFSCCLKPKVAPTENELSRTTSGIIIDEPPSQPKGTGVATVAAQEEAKAASTEPTPRNAVYHERTSSVTDNPTTEYENSFVESPAPRHRALSTATGTDAPRTFSRTLESKPADAPHTIPAWPAMPSDTSHADAEAPHTPASIIPMTFALSAAATVQAVTPTNSVEASAVPASSLSSGVMGPLSSLSGLPSDSPTPTTTSPSDASGSYSLGPSKST